MRDHGRRYDFLPYRVADAMTKAPLTVGASTELAEAASIFEQHQFNGLPVVEDERLLGFFTKLDLLKAFVFTPESVIPHYDEIMRQPVERFMTRRPTCTDPETPLTRVLQQIIDTGHKSIPVLEGERLVGIIAREDVLHALQQALGGSAPA